MSRSIMLTQVNVNGMETGQWESRYSHLNIDTGGIATVK